MTAAGRYPRLSGRNLARVGSALPGFCAVRYPTFDRMMARHCAVGVVIARRASVVPRTARDSGDPKVHPVTSFAPGLRTPHGGSGGPMADGVDTQYPWSKLSFLDPAVSGEDAPLARDPMRRVRDLAARVAPVSMTVPHRRESGGEGNGSPGGCTPRRRVGDRPFVAVNCGPSPTRCSRANSLATCGAFTGATTDRAGCRRRRTRAPLFLDEIGEVSPAMQYACGCCRSARCDAWARRGRGRVDVRVADRDESGPAAEPAPRPVPRGPLLPAARRGTPRPSAA